MQQFILIIITLFFLIAIARQCLYWSWLWQLKEYRIDRVQAHFQDIGFKSTFLALIGYSSLRQYKIPKFTVKAAIIGFLSFLSAITVLVIVFKVYLQQIYLAISSIEQSSLSNFNISKDSINLSAVKSVILSISRLLGDYQVVIETMAAIFIVMPVIIYLVVIILNILSGVVKARTIRKAKVKIANFPNLKVIGITGSYGKTSTKEILADILSEKYKVLMTPANINTAIGISQLILNEMDKTYEVFIVEMGAYKIGEIKEVCEIVKPNIGIITAINEQHLAMFGNIKNTIKAKFELFDCLPSAGLAILNIGDENIQAGMELRNSLADELKPRVKLYSVGAKSDVYAIGEVSDRQSIKFEYISGSIMKNFIVNITGAHNISNVLAVIIAALELGMDLDKISRILQKNNYSNVALKNLAGSNGSTLINDTYNANPAGVFAALRHIKNQRGGKIIIMSSLIELGSSAREIHQKIGNEISRIASKVYFLDNYYISDIRKGAAENKESDVEIKNEKNAKKIAEDLKNELKPSDTVLFINRGAGKVLELLKK